MEPFTSIAAEKVVSSISEEAKFLKGVKEQVEDMKAELEYLQSFLEDVDYHIRNNAHSLTQRKKQIFRRWVFQIREASLDAEDIVDAYTVKVELRKRGGMLNLIRRYAGIPRHAMHVHGVGSEIESLKSKFSSLKLRLQNYGIKELGLGDAASSSSSGHYAKLLQTYGLKELGLREGGSSTSSGPKSLQRRSYGHIQDRNVVGLEENIDEVVGLLLKKEEAAACKVVSIYGMGGLGKTTLAKKVYHNKRVRTHFDKFAWVYVSQQFKERDVWESTLEGLTGVGRKKISELSHDDLAARLLGVQKEHKCLVVLDDVWSIGDWEKLKDGFCLQKTSSSKILVTTHNKKLAAHVDRRGSYEGLKRLSGTKSLKLLRKIALQGREHKIASADKKTMEELEKRMLKHCGGIPLAITVLGGILASKLVRLSEWQAVHDNINLRRGKGHEEEQGSGVQHVLDYGYHDLPPELKICFLYLSLFPEDYEIKTNKLMRMWMTEGFLSVEYDGEGYETVEDVAVRFLNELVNRRMVQVGKMDCTGRVKTCKLHDLMRDLCLSKAKEENLVHNYNDEIVRTAIPRGKIRRLCFIGEDPDSHEVSLSSYKRNYQVRSLILHCNEYSGRSMGLETVQLVDKFKVLKMLLLEGIDLRNMKGCSKGIGKLILLRYLSLRMSWIHGWPSLDKLGCMEILDLRVAGLRSNRHPLKVSEIWQMKQLRHLYFPDYSIGYSTDGADIESKPKPNLQTLVNFPLKCGVDGILRFPNMRKLHMLQGKYVSQLWEILNNNKTSRFSRLYSFTLTTRRFLAYYEEVDLEAVVAKCPSLYKLNVGGRIKKFPQLNQFPNKLTKLVLTASRIEDPEHIEATLGSLPSLTILNLQYQSFMGEQLSFKKDTFPQLITLSLQWLFELKSWEVEEWAMPNLQLLEIYHVRKLEAIPQGLIFIKNLNQLQIKDMRAGFAARVKEGGADFDIVKHVPSITIRDC